MKSIIILVAVLALSSVVWAEDAPQPQPAPTPVNGATEVQQPAATVTQPTAPVAQPVAPNVQPAASVAQPATAAAPAQPARPTAPAMRPMPSMTPPPDILARMFPGLGLDDQSKVNWEALPFGMDKKFLTSLPVGAVENPGGVDFPAYPGWRIEEVFKLSNEQSTSLQKLRNDYEAEKAKLGQELAEAQKAYIEKFRALRLQYEQQANDLLTGPEKEAKAKLDALRDELAAKKKELVNTLGLDKPQTDSRGFMELSKKTREELSKVVAEFEAKLLDLLPTDRKAAIEGMVKQQAQRREGMVRRMQGERPMPSGPRVMGPQQQPVKAVAPTVAPAKAEEAKVEPATKVEATGPTPQPTASEPETTKP